MKGVARALSALVAGACFAMGACRGPGAEPLAEIVSGAEPEALSPSGFTDIDLELRPLRPLEAGTELILFVHLVDAGGRLVRTFDKALGDDWPLGGSVRQTIRIFLSTLVDPPPAGDYSLTVGLYDLILGRFPVRTELRRAGKWEYEIARVRIDAAARAAARLEFVDGWRAAEDVANLQAIRQRPLRPGERGSLLLHPITRRTEFWLMARIPAPSLADRLEILDGGETARLRVSSSCAGSSIEVEGPGSHAISIALTPGETQSCELTVEANHWVRLDSADRFATSSIEAAAWKPL